MQLNTPFKEAKEAKNDEFYTQLSTIEKELTHYTQHFQDKVVYCNCDNPEHSQFWRYFYDNFARLGLKKLIATYYTGRMPVYKWEYEGKEITKTKLQWLGSFDSPECVRVLQESDIVVTNPPFSLFRKYMTTVLNGKTRVLVIGSINAISYKDIFLEIKENRLWIGNKTMGSDMLFDIPQSYADWLIVNKKAGSAYRVIDGVVKGRAPCIWFTNLSHKKRNNDLHLIKPYTSDDYPKYDNYDAIEVSKVKDIPHDYKGLMGVPISFLDKHNPTQFAIVGNEYDLDIKRGRCYIAGKRMYSRIFIKHLHPTKNVI